MFSLSSSAPTTGVRYPLKVGRSITKAPGARSFVQLKFSHIGVNVDVSRPGVLSPSRESCKVALSSKKDAAKSVSYSFHKLKKVSTVGNYVLVFADDVFWLEEVDDVYLSTRAGTVADAADVPDAGDDDFANHPESWMDVDTASPVTHDGSDAEEQDIGLVASKSILQVPERKRVPARTLQPMLDAVVGRSGGKTVAMTTLPTDTPSEEDDDHSNNDDTNGGNMSEEIEEIELVASSSDDDASSDDSDSSAESTDSDDYTDRSSDED